MNRNDSIMFSRDGKRFHKATFIDHCELNACKIKLSGEEWTVKRSEVCSIGEWMKVRADKFYDENRQLIDQWNEAETRMSFDKDLKISKASIAKELKIEPSKFCYVLSQWTKVHAPALAVK